MNCRNITYYNNVWEWWDRGPQVKGSSKSKFIEERNDANGIGSFCNSAIFCIRGSGIFKLTFSVTSNSQVWILVVMHHAPVILFQTTGWLTINKTLIFDSVNVACFFNLAISFVYVEVYIAPRSYR